MVFPPFLGALQKKVILFFEVDFLSCFSQFWSADFPAISSCRRSSRSTKPPAWRRPKNGWTRCGAAWRGEPRMACCWKPMFLVASRCFKPKTSLVQSDLGSWYIMIIMIPKWLIYFAGDWTILIHIETTWIMGWSPQDGWCAASGEFLREALAQQIKDAAQLSQVWSRSPLYDI